MANVPNEELLERIKEVRETGDRENELPGLLALAKEQSRVNINIGAMMHVLQKGR